MTTRTDAARRVSVAASAGTVSTGVPLSEPAYQAVRAMLYRNTGIELGPRKQALVFSRLVGRAGACGLPDLDHYVSRLCDGSDPEEAAWAMDLLTTNETYFLREPKHFDVLAGHARACALKSASFSVWSAASSSGEEAYTIAMVLQSLVDGGTALNWDILGSDISRRMLDVAERGIYPVERVDKLPTALLHRYAMRGEGPAAGTVLVERRLRARLRWQQVNLIRPLPAIGPFDAVFLRNVMIYFDAETKQRVLHAVAPRVRPGGLLFIGTTESAFGHLPGWSLLSPGVYCKPAAAGAP